MYTIGIFMDLSKAFDTIEHSTRCPKINFTFLNGNNVRTNIRIAPSAVYIVSGDL